MVIRVERDEKNVIKTEWPRYCDNWQNSHCSALSARDMTERRRLTPSPPAAPSTPAGWQLRGVTPGQGPTLHTLWSVFSWTYFIIPTRLQALHSATLDSEILFCKVLDLASVSVWSERKTCSLIQQKWSSLFQPSCHQRVSIFSLCVFL